MKHIILSLTCVSALLLTVAQPVLADNGGGFYSGEGVEGGIDQANAFETGGGTDVRETLTNILFGVLTFMGFIAVLMIVIAGIYLIIGGADEQQRDKAKKIVLYTVIGLLIILLAGAMVQFVATEIVGAT